MRSAVVGLSLAMAVLAGCGDVDTPTVADDPTTPVASPDPTPTIAPADGPTLSSKSFTITLPKGWTALPRESAEVLVSGMDPQNEEAPPTVLVLRALNGSGAAAVTREHTRLGHRSIRTHDDVMVAGESVAHVSAVNPRKGGPLRFDSFVLTHEGRTYTVRFATSDWMNAKDRDALIASVLATWTWR